jgi:hypothetical protein
MVGFVHFPMGTLTPKIAVSGKFTFAQEMFLVQFLVAGTAVHGRFVVKSFVFLFGQRVAAQVLGQKTTRVAFVVCGLVVLVLLVLVLLVLVVLVLVVLVLVVLVLVALE